MTEVHITISLEILKSQWLTDMLLT